MADTTVTRVVGRRVWDSRGRPTVEAEVQLACGAMGRAMAPAGASRGSGEAAELRDPDPVLGTVGVASAVAHVNGEISRALRGHDGGDQRAFDSALIALDGTQNKSRLGANAIVAVSLAAAHAAARASGVPLYRHLAGGRALGMPLPQIQIFGGGAHAGRRIDIQDLMAMPLAARSFDEALEISARVYGAAGAILREQGILRGVADEGGYWPEFGSNEQAIETLVRAIERAGYSPGAEVGVALDIAASELYRDARYHLGLECRVLDGDELAELLGRWIERYPIVSIEDPLAEGDRDGMMRFTRAHGANVQIVGDDYLVTDAERVKAAAADGACNAVLLKPNQAGTVTETHDALEAARVADFATIVSARSGETEDTSIAHLAVGWNAGQIKVGSMARGERTAKWNELLRIEEASDAPFPGRVALRRFR